MKCNENQITTVSDNFGLIVRAFFTLAGVIYMFSMSDFHIYSTNKISFLRTSKYLMDYNKSMKMIKILLYPT